MFPTFLPSQVELLRDLEAIACLQSIERIALATPLSQQAILTTYIHQGSKGTPILLLHGFDSSVLEFRLLLPLLTTYNETWTDDMLAPEDAEKFQKDIKNSRLIKIQNCGHTPQVEQPKIIAQHILQFLNYGKF